MTDDSILEFESCVGRVVGRAIVRFPRLVPADRHVGAPDTGEALYFPKEILDHVLPVTEHIDDDAAILLLPVVPGGPLQRLGLSGEHPISKLTADREYFPEETRVYQVFQLHEAGEP